MTKHKNTGSADKLQRTYADARTHIVRRQNAVYAAFLAMGIFLVAQGTLHGDDHFSHGIAFITVGMVGFIMSLTTVDIGHSLKEAIREEGAETRAVIAELGKRMEERDKRIDARLAAMDKRMEERDKRMEERDKRMEERLERMSTTIETISKDNRAFFKQILETQNRILEKVS